MAHTTHHTGHSGLLQIQSSLIAVTARKSHATWQSRSMPLLRQHVQSCNNWIRPLGMLTKRSSSRCCCCCHSKHLPVIMQWHDRLLLPRAECIASSGNGTSSSSSGSSGAASRKGPGSTSHSKTYAAARVATKGGASDDAVHTAGIGSGSGSGSSGMDGDGSSGGGRGGGGSSGSGDGGPSDKPKFPAWYTVWMWVTALVYLVWRWRWRRGRRLAAEQLAKEQQLQEQADKEWHRFAQHYGVTAPQDKGS